MPQFKQHKLAFLASVIMTVSACTDSQTVANPVNFAQDYKYAPPSYLNDGWQVGHLADYGFDELMITQLIQNIEDDIFVGIDSISIVHKNTLILHQDFRTTLSKYDGWVGNTDLNTHLMNSTSKSFVSALTGIAIEQGYISGINTPFYQLFDYSDYDNWSNQKEAVTLKNVLTMRLGLEWDEWTSPYSEEKNSLTNLVQNNSDYIKALLDLPMTSEPGSKYAYNTAASMALGRAVEVASNIPLADFAKMYLFEPMQIDSAQWLFTPTNTPNTGSGLFLKTRDMAKFGQLYLDNGVWNGIQIINPEWVNASLEKQVELNWNYTNGYGLQWWLGNFQTNGKSIPFYSSRGYGGQFIIIVPDYDLVVAFTGQNYENGLYDSPFSLVEEYIIPAINGQ
jgi:CubicO group peptidase (beta-lactamase class C family)